MPDDRNVRGGDTVAFLKQLKRHIPGAMTIVWDRGNTKYGRLANFALEDTVELRRALVEGLETLAGRQDLLAAFIRNTKVPIRLRIPFH